MNVGNVGSQKMILFTVNGFVVFEFRNSPFQCISSDTEVGRRWFRYLLNVCHIFIEIGKMLSNF